MLLNTPNILTLGRILAIPLIVVFTYMPGKLWNMCALAIFAIACLSDYLDGYFARVWNQSSSFGRFLDPVADKLLVASILLILCALDRIQGLHLVPAFIILCREILVSGLREYLAELQEVVPVSGLAKWKTTIQMIALGFLILSPQVLSPLTQEIGLYGLWVAALITLMTGFDYLKASAKHFSED